MQPTHNDEENEPLECPKTYSDYNCGKSNLGKQHPYPLVETACLATVSLPSLYYKTRIPTISIEKGRLSSAQLEALSYICQQHEYIMANGDRGGFLLGDGTGVGKGRVLAAAIFENWLCGRKRSLWVTSSTELRQDCIRDLRDLGANKIRVHALSDQRCGHQIRQNCNDGVLFCTYSTLISESKTSDNEFSRIQQVYSWLGKGFDGLIILDECHRGKNLCPNSTKKPTKTGDAISKLQAEFKRARLIYASATCATEPKNMAYLSRLGIWGYGTPFQNFESFIDRVQSSNISIMELVAMEMKRRGSFLARQLSFDGTHFEIQKVILSHTFSLIYDKCVVLWRQVLQNFQEAAVIMQPDNIFKRKMWSQFWNSHQRFFRHLCLAAKVDRAVKISMDAIKKGKCVVIGLQSTGEAIVSNEMAQSGDRDFISTTKGILKALITTYFPTPGNVTGQRHLEMSIKNQVQLMQNQLLKSLKELGPDMPNNSLDVLIHALGGPENVAEMTGRTGRFIKSKNGHITYESRNPQKNINEEKKKFMNDEKRICIISDAASTGISLQSDKTVANQRQRIHITLELPWSADKMMQQLGRTHRSNQVNAPDYVFLILELGGEYRVASAVSKRLQSLGALSHGDRRATSTADFSQFEIDNKYGRLALEALLKLVKTGIQVDVPDMPPRINFLKDTTAAMLGVGLLEMNKDSSTSNSGLKVSQFLNRMLGIEVALQNIIFNYYLEIVDAITAKAKFLGKFDSGILSLSNPQKTSLICTKNFVRERLTGSGAIQLKEVCLERGMTWEEVDQKYRTKTGVSKEFYISRSGTNGHSLPILVMMEGLSDQAKKKNLYCHVFRPNTGIQQKLQRFEDIKQHYQLASREEAKQAWISQFSKSENCCSHIFWSGMCQNVNAGIHCEFGIRQLKFYILTGALLLCWDDIEAVMQDRKIQIVKAEPINDSVFVGILVPKEVVNKLEKRLLD